MDQCYRTVFILECHICYAAVPVDEGVCWNCLAGAEFDRILPPAAKPLPSVTPLPPPPRHAVAAAAAAAAAADAAARTS